MAKDENKNSIIWIAVLRGVSALFVFFSHLSVLPISHEVMFVIGRIGVVCFFLITGYLTIPAREKRTWKQYTANRFSRIYPEYWILLIIMFIAAFPRFTFRQVLINFTAFQEFFGVSNILGASWMLPIQVVFFCIITMFGTKLFIYDYKDTKRTIKRGYSLLTLCMMFSLLTSILRYLTNRPFPTAFFLLIGVSIIAIYIWYIDKIVGSKEILGIFIAIFEVGLFLSCYLSYKEQLISYLLAYNIGIILFFVFKKGVIIYNYRLAPMIRLGEIGYPFFLGADIPYVIMRNIINLEGNFLMVIIGCLLRFLFAIILAIVMRMLVEKPMFRLEQKIEEKLGR